MGPSASTASAPLSNRQLKARMKQAEKKLEQCSHVNQTPFRSAERNFKSRTPPPDFSNVIYPSSQPVSEQLVPVQLTQDLRMLSPHFGTSDASWEQRSHQAYVLKELPGLVIIPNPFTPAAQRHLIQHCLSDYPRSPNTSNLHTHYHIPPTGLWPLYEQEQNGTIPMDDPRHFVAKKHTTNDAEEEEEETKQRTLAIPLKACDDTFKPDMQVTKPDPPAASTVPLLSATDLLRRLRWITLGYHYHWPTRTYHLNRRFPVPDVVTSLAKSVVCAIEQVGHDGVWKNTYSAAQYQPEAGVVNYYQYKDTLMGHVDRSELNMDAPLVSISLGNACIYLLGGQDRTTKPVALYLQSGDIIAMTQPCRRSFHGVPRILENTLPDYLAEGPEDWALFGKYMETSRLNINIRQVNPSNDQE